MVSENRTVHCFRNYTFEPERINNGVMKTGKNKNQVSLFEAISYEYLFVISPKEVEADVRMFKEKLHELIGLPSQVLNSIPHISLYHFYSAGDVDTILKKSLQALSGFRAFKVRLDGIKTFGSEQYDRTMYIDVEKSDELENLHSALQMTFLRKGEKFHPHLTIARGIKPDKYALIVPNLPDFEFFSGFDCQQITLLRKRLGEEMPYERVRIINLEG